MITVDRRDFTNALRRACKLAPKHTSLLALRNVQLKTDAESITLRTTNLEQALVEVLPATSDGKAKLVGVCVPVTQLLGVVQALPQYLKEVPIHASTDHVLVGTTKLMLGCPLEDYPMIPRLPDKMEAMIELPDDFMRHLRFVRTAVATNNLTRLALNGVLFDFAHGNIVGCDGKRLHCAHLWNPSKVGPVIVPASAFDVDVPTQLVIPKADKKDAEQVFFFVQNGYVSTRTIEGSYPDYLAIVRKEHRLTATLDRLELAGALEQSLPMINERTPSCTLHLNEQFEIHAENPENGSEYVNEVPAALDGPELTTSINPAYLLSMLRTMTGETVTLAFREPGEAVYIVSDHGDQWALLMPLKTNMTPTNKVQEAGGRE